MQADLSKTNNYTDVFYQSGRIAHIIFDVKPVIVTQAYEEEYQNSFKLAEEEPQEE
jgi:hypothetical protein